MGNWKIIEAGKGKYRVRHTDTDEYTKIVYSRQEGLDWKNQIEPTLSYDTEGKLILKPKEKKPTEKEKKIQAYKNIDAGQATLADSVYAGITPERFKGEKSKSKVVSDKIKSLTDELREMDADRLALMDLKKEMGLLPTQELKLKTLTRKLHTKSNMVHRLQRDNPDWDKKKDSDQIMIDPKTKKKYRFVGPDRSDPNSYEEI